MKNIKEMEEIIADPDISEKARRVWKGQLRDTILDMNDMAQDMLDFKAHVEVVEVDKEYTGVNRVPQPYDIATIECDCGHNLKVVRSHAKLNKWVSCLCGVDYPTKHLSYDGYDD